MNKKFSWVLFGIMAAVCLSSPAYGYEAFATFTVDSITSASCGSQQAMYGQSVGGGLGVYGDSACTLNGQGLLNGPSELVVGETYSTAPVELTPGGSYYFCLKIATAQKNLSQYRTAGKLCGGSVKGDDSWGSTCSAFSFSGSTCGYFYPDTAVYACVQRQNRNPAGLNLVFSYPFQEGALPTSTLTSAHASSCITLGGRVSAGNGFSGKIFNGFGSTTAAITPATSLLNNYQCNSALCIYGSVKTAYPASSESTVQCVSDICISATAYDSCLDGDGDGHDIYNAVNCTAGTDCDDTDPNNYPGNSENCSDGTDNDCDNDIDCADSGCAGNPACVICEDNDGDTYDGYDAVTCDMGTDCDDTDSAINPGASEICDDVGAVDEDCDGAANCADDECSALPACTCTDADTDTYYAVDAACPGGDDCDDTDSAINTGAAEICDDAGDVDEDCDGAANCADLDCAGHFSCPCAGCCDDDGDGYAGRTGDCLGGTDCDDSNPLINPGALETCDDLADNDCDTYADCDDSDCTCIECHDNDNDGALGLTPNCPAIEGGADCDDFNPNIHPAIIEEGDEMCGNGLDDDCDGFEDCDDPGCGIAVNCMNCSDNDNDGFRGFDAVDCPAGRDCDDADAGINPDKEDVCGNGIDEDCSGMDTACACNDEDNDGYFIFDEILCPQGNDCDDHFSWAYPGAIELCFTQEDNDCDGKAGCKDSECIGDPNCVCYEGGDYDNDGYISRACLGGNDCDDSNPKVYPKAMEICGNGIDEDCDGKDIPCSSVGLSSSPKFDVDLNHNKTSIPGDVREILVSTNEIPIPGAVISTTPPLGKAVGLKTDGEGIAKFQLGQAGVYRVTITKGGYKTFVGSFRINGFDISYSETVAVGGPQKITVSFGGSPVSDATLEVTPPSGREGVFSVELDSGGNAVFKAGEKGIYTAKLIRKEIVAAEIAFEAAPASVFSAEAWSGELGKDIFKPAKADNPVPLFLVLIIALIAGQIAFFAVANRPIKRHTKINSVLWGLAAFTVTLVSGLWMAAASALVAAAAIILSWRVWKNTAALPGAGVKPVPGKGKAAPLKPKKK